MPFLNEVKQKALGFVSTNSSALLTAGGVVGTVATAVLTGRAGYKYSEVIRKEQDSRLTVTELGLVDTQQPLPKLDKWEKAKLSWPYFLPPIITGTATITAIIFANRMSAQKAAALAAAYGLAERNLSEYKEKISEKLTGPKAQQVDDELSQDRVNKTDGYQNIVIVEGEVLCFDEPTARYFRSTMENIKSAVNAVNAEILNHDFASAGFFYEELGMAGTTWTDEMGWNRDGLVELKYSTVLSPDGRPCLAIDFKVPPRPDYIPKHY